MGAKSIHIDARKIGDMDSKSYRWTHNRIDGRKRIDGHAKSVDAPCPHVLGHDVVVWAGDLNYRITLPRDLVKNDLICKHL